jgi:rRNA maturation endonuclease Nob1
MGVKIVGYCIANEHHKVVFNYKHNKKGFDAIENLPLCPICGSSVKISEIEVDKK